MASISKKKTLIGVGSQIAAITLICKKAKSKKMKAAGIIAVLLGGELVGYADAVHTVKKYDPNAKLSVKSYYKGLYDAVESKRFV